MKLKTTTARTALATALILTAIAFQPSTALSQADMKDMPGMAPKATPTPNKTVPASTPKPAAATKAQQAELPRALAAAERRVATTPPLSPSTDTE